MYKVGLSSSNLDEKMTLVRFKSNPFLEEMMIPVGKKQIRVGLLGKDSNILVNTATGEERGTHVATYKKVDNEQFVKIFTQNIAMTFDLSSAGIKCFSLLLFQVQNSALSKDVVALDALALNEFLEAHKESDPPLKLSIATMKRGINELEKAKIVAKTMRQGFYYINPNFVFNGDRIAFTTIIERDKK